MGPSQVAVSTTKTTEEDNDDDNITKIRRKLRKLIQQQQQIEEQQQQQQHYQQQQRQKQRNLQDRCPFQERTESNPCYHPACTVFNTTVCQEYTLLYCHENAGTELEGCAEYLDKFMTCEYDNVLSPEAQDAITKGILEGRNGLGIIYLIASGNEYARGEVVNMEGWLNSRFTIAVGAVGKNGYVASYSTPGAALFVAGPGGDSEFLANHITAFPSIPGGGGPTCVDASVGTSFATPAVAGVVALLLEANPELTWRDVQGILALTSQRVYRYDDSWTMNGAGIAHSYKFGFGVVDALAAVEASRSWQKWGPEIQITQGSQAINLPILDSERKSDSTKSILTIPPDGDAATMTVESVVIYLELNHSSRGDLKITLTSPNGTESTLLPGNRPENSVPHAGEKWKLMTVRNWGESPVGDWTLTISDKNQDNPQCSDLPFNPFVPDLGGTFSCSLIEQYFPPNVTNCLDSSNNETSLVPFAAITSHGNTFMTACCRCGGGIPSSSVPSVLISWQLIAYGHSTPPSGANDALVSPSCSFDSWSGCDQHEFCGLDGKCHPSSCHEFYQFGPTDFTGYDPENPAKITCSDYGQPTHSAIQFGCSAVHPDEPVPGDVIPFYFNQICKATLPHGMVYECYDIKPGTNIADVYVSNVESPTTTPPTCEDGSAPMYHYMQTHEKDLFGNNFRTFIPRSNPAFVESLAMTSVATFLKDGQDECFPSGPNACPFDALFSGVCDGCTGDCFDCDPCMQHSWTNCMTCTQDPNLNCVWCSGDAICQSKPLGQSFWGKYLGRKTTSCPVEQFWAREGQCQRTDGTVFGDPLYDSMVWSYKLLHVEDVWRSGITGAGVHVRVNDDGVAADHPEFTANFDVENSCEVYLPENPATDVHGTACASIIAGSTNDVCAVGIASGATLSACRLTHNDEDYEAEAKMFLTALDTVDISSNSWGPVICLSPYVRGRQLQESCPFLEDNFNSPCEICSSEGWQSEICQQVTIAYCLGQFEDDPIGCAEFLDLFVQECRYHMLAPESQQTFQKAIQEGRGGKGVIFVFAAGNDYALGVDANNDGYINTRFTIAVGAVGKDGRHASYSTAGAAVFVSGPGGDKESVSNNIVAKPGGGCHDITIGTSFAAPAVAGVIALILEKNSELSWRDVQGILASTSYVMEPDDVTWVLNKGGYHHSYKYGFGVANASAAVEAAATWVTLPLEKQALGSSGKVNIPIPDDETTSAESTVQVTISETKQFSFVESVVAYIKLTHPTRGDLQITLISPSGTESVLAVGDRPEQQQVPLDQEWKLLSLRTWGEKPDGTWTLRLVDKSKGRMSDCSDLTDWYYVDPDGIQYTCLDFEGLPNKNCLPPNVPEEWANHTVNNYTMTEACCNCGGGIDLTQVQSTLVSWRLMVYGHLEVGAPTVAPVATPSPTFSAAPTTTPGAPTTTPADGAPTTSPAPGAPTAAPVAGPPGAETPAPTNATGTDNKSGAKTWSHLVGATTTVGLVLLIGL